MKLSFSTLGCPEWDFQQIIDCAIKFHIDGVELRGTEGEHVSPKLSPKSKKEIQKQFEDAGLLIYGVSAYSMFTSPSQSEREKHEETLIKYLELGEELGASYVRTFLGKIGEETNLSTIDGYMAESLNRVADLSRGLKCEIVIETHHDYSGYKPLSGILPLLDSSRMGILWDVAHSFFDAGEDVMETYAGLRDWIRHIHVRDERSTNGQVENCYPGYGDLPWKSLLQRLEDDQFTGTYCFEWERKWQPDLAPLDKAMPYFVELMHGKKRSNRYGEK